MAKIHENAALTITQRKLIRNLYLEGTSISSLARRYCVNRKTAQRWAKRESPYDVPSGAKTPWQIDTEQHFQRISNMTLS